MSESNEGMPDLNRNSGEQKEIREEIPYLNKLIMRAEQPYPSYGEAKELTTEEIRGKYEKVLKELSGIADIKPTTVGKFAKECFLKSEAEAMICEKINKYGRAMICYGLAGLSKYEMLKDDKEAKKYLDQLNLNSKERKIAEEDIKKANEVQKLTEKIENMKEISNKAKKMRENLESIVQKSAGKPLNQLSEEEIDGIFSKVEFEEEKIK